MNDWLCDWEANAGNLKGRLVMLLFRIAHAIRAHRLWLAGAPVLAFYEFFVVWCLGIELRYRTRVGPRLRLFHGQGLVVAEDAVLGAGCTLRQSTTIGGKAPGGGAPVLGDGVEVGANAVILGAITIGDGAIIGAGSVVVKDVPARAVVAGNPARIIRQG